MSHYTPAPPDHFLVIEGRDHFLKLDPGKMPSCAAVSSWSRSQSESLSSDSRFLEADVAGLANAVIRALQRFYEERQPKDRRQIRRPLRGRVRPSGSATGARRLQGSNAMANTFSRERNEYE